MNKKEVMANTKKRCFSQVDFFRDSDAESRKSKRRTASTYDPASKPYSYLYEYVILFDWNVDVTSPFFHYKLDLFKDSDIKPEWVSKNLGVKSRISKLKNLSPFPGQVFSLFSKIELGKHISVHVFIFYTYIYAMTV